MTAWRMAFRAGTHGYEMWPRCKRLGIAALGYEPVNDIDLSKYPVGEPRPAWSQLAPSQHASLKRFLYEIHVGDVIYVKQGPIVAGHGTLTGPYQFDKKNRIEEPSGASWQHQRRVNWDPLFPHVSIQIGLQQAVTLVAITESDVKRVEQSTANSFGEASDIEGTKTETTQLKSKRSRKLRDLAFRAANGICAVCHRDFSKLLSGQGKRVLQVHHLDQLSAREMPSVTTTKDLAVVCANCHLLLHLDPSTSMRIEELRGLLEIDGSGWLA